MNTPKPAPPRTNLKPLAAKALESIDRGDYTFKSGQTESLPPINMKSPDGTRVVTVTDPEKAKSMAKKGWKITEDKKTPYVPLPHLTNKPFQDEGLAALRRSMEPEKKQAPVKRRPFRKNNKEKN